MVIWLAIFALTCVLELPVYVLFLRRVLPIGWGLLLLLALNLSTHPIVWFLLPRLLPNQVHYVLVAEAFAVLVEGLLLIAVTRWRRLPNWNALALIGLSFLANAGSATVGELLGYRLLGWLGLLPPGTT
jgi:hypothetical protein